MAKFEFKNPLSDTLLATNRIVAEGCFVDNDTHFEHRRPYPQWRCARLRYRLRP